MTAVVLIMTGVLDYDGVVDHDNGVGYHCCRIPVIIMSPPLSYCSAPVTLLPLYCTSSYIILYIMSYIAAVTL